jgi:hypothetical protein
MELKPVSPTAKAPAQNFTGDVYVNQVKAPDEPSRLIVGYVRMRPGDTVWTPPGEEHWHGATEGNFMCHFAMLEGNGTSDGTTWLEPVTDDHYKAVNEN